MPAPKKPNTEAARAASLVSRERAKREREVKAAAALLRESGWTIFPPESAEEDLCGSSFCALAALAERNS